MLQWVLQIKWKAKSDGTSALAAANGAVWWRRHVSKHKYTQKINRDKYLESAVPGRPMTGRLPLARGTGTAQGGGSTENPGECGSDGQASQSWPCPGAPSLCISPSETRPVRGALCRRAGISNMAWFIYTNTLDNIYAFSCDVFSYITQSMCL